MFSIKGKIVTPDRIVDGYVNVNQDRISDVTEEKPAFEKVYDFGQNLVLPGFVDIHLHGIGNFDTVDAANLAGMAKLQPQYGTTSFLPTAAAMSKQQYADLGKDARDAIAAVGGDGAKIQGIHLEGPFINPKSSGAMAHSTRRPIEQDEAEYYIEQIGDLLRILTFSPELENGLYLTETLKKHNIVASLGHSVAEPHQLPSLVEAGLSHVVHMFNAFVPSGEKEQGVLKAGLLEHILLNDKLTCEFICDTHHVAPEYLTIASRVLGPDRFVAITDSLPGAGFLDGIFQFPNGSEFKIENGVARLYGGEQDGCLCGSVLTMNRAFFNLINICQIDTVLAARYTSLNAARVIGMDDQIGSIEPGKCADITVLNSDYECIATFVNGKLVYKN